MPRNRSEKDPVLNAIIAFRDALDAYLKACVAEGWDPRGRRYDGTRESTLGLYRHMSEVRERDIVPRQLRVNMRGGPDGWANILEDLDQHLKAS